MTSMFLLEEWEMDNHCLGEASVAHVKDIANSISCNFKYNYFMFSC